MDHNIPVPHKLAGCVSLGTGSPNTPQTGKQDYTNIWRNPAHDLNNKQTSHVGKRSSVRFNTCLATYPHVSTTGKQFADVEEVLPQKVLPAGAKRYSKKHHKFCTEEHVAQCYSGYFKQFPHMNPQRANQNDILDQSMTYRDCRVNKERKVLIPTHNLTILPANSLLFHGRPLCRRPVTNISPDEGVPCPPPWYHKLTPDQDVTESPRSPGRAMATRPCRERVRSSGQDRRWRQLSAVVLPRIRYDGDSSSDDDEALRDGETNTCTEEADSKAEKETKDGKRTQSAPRRSKVGQKSPVNSIGFSFNVEKMTLKAIPVAEVKDLTEYQNEVQWRDRRERKQRRVSRAEPQRARTSDVSTCCRTRRDEDEYKYRMPHLDDNVRTMMNSTPFCKNSNRIKLKPPQSLEAIRAHLVSKNSDYGYEDNVESRFVSPWKDGGDHRQFPTAPPQSPVNIQAKDPPKTPQSRKLDDHTKSNISKSNGCGTQKMHQNTFVRNSSDFCTPFCSNLLDAESFQKNQGSNERLQAGDLGDNWLMMPSEDVWSVDTSKRFEKTFRYSQDHVAQDGHEVQLAKDVHYQRQDVTETEVSIGETHTRNILGESTCTESEHQENTRDLSQQCPSPDHSMGKPEKIHFSQPPEQNIPVFKVLESRSLTRCESLSRANLSTTQRDSSTVHGCSDAHENEGNQHRVLPCSNTGSQTEVHLDTTNTGEPSVLQDKETSPFVDATPEISKRNLQMDLSHTPTDSRCKWSEVEAENLECMEVSHRDKGQQKYLSTLITGDGRHSNIGYATHSETFALSHSQKQTHVQGLTELSRAELVDWAEERQKNGDNNNIVNQLPQRKISRKILSRNNSNTKFVTLTDKIKNKQKPSSTHHIFSHKKQIFNSCIDNSGEIETQKESSSGKPPLRRGVRYKNFSNNPDFVLFRSLELTCVEEESVGLDLQEAGFTRDTSTFTPHQHSHGVCLSCAPRCVNSHPSPCSPGCLNNRLVSHISELGRLRGYGGPEVANLGVEDHHHEFYMRQHSNGWPNFLRHKNVSHSYTSYNCFKNTKQRRSRKTPLSYSACSSRQNRYPDRKTGHTNRATKSQERTQRRHYTPSIPLAASTHSNVSHKPKIYPHDSEPVSKTEEVYCERQTPASRSVSCPGAGPVLYHAPSCPDVQQRRSRSQGHQRRSPNALEPPYFDIKQREAVQARLAFNNMRLIHNARQGAFSKFYFSRISLSIFTEGDNIDSSDMARSKDQTEVSDCRPTSEVPMFSRPPSNGLKGRGFSERRFEDRRMKHHSIFSSLMTPHDLSLTSQTQKELTMDDGNDVMLKGKSCQIEPARARYIPPPVDYPQLILKPSKSSVRVRHDVVRLPPIGQGEDLSSISSSVKDDTPPELKPLPEVQKPLPEILCQASLKERKPKPEAPLVLTEAEEVKWRSEQRLEMMSTPPSGYTPPRLVLISSRMPWCQSMANAVRRDGHILYIVYDFDTWTFQDILRECRTQLDHFRPGCKPLSVMMISKGGPGYFYLLKKYVTTPQKVKRSWYKGMKEFWKHLADMISKLRPEEAVLHLVGTEFETSEQGRKLKYELSRLMLPNKVKVVTTCDNTSQGRSQIELYFDYRKYLLWRSKAVSNFDLVDAQKVTRSWSSIEEEARRKEAIFGSAFGAGSHPDADEVLESDVLADQETFTLGACADTHIEADDILRLDVLASQETWTRANTDGGEESNFENDDVDIVLAQDTSNEDLSPTREERFEEEEVTLVPVGETEGSCITPEMTLGYEVGRSDFGLEITEQVEDPDLEQSEMLGVKDG